MKTSRPLGQSIFTALILILFVLTVGLFLSPVLMGLLVALVAKPLHMRLSEALRGRDRLAALGMTVVISFVFVVPLILVLLQVGNQAIDLVSRLNAQSLLETYRRWLSYVPMNPQMLEEYLGSFLKSLGAKATTIVGQIAASLPAIALDFIIFAVALYYGLADGQRLSAFALNCLPFDPRERAAIATTIETICRGVVLGSLLAGLVQGVIIGVAFACFQVPGALLFGAVTLMFSFVPAFGSGPTGLGGAIYLWSQGRTGAALAMLAALGLASISDNVVKPWVLRGGDTELHPLLGLISALGGLAMFGFAGLFLGPLFAALGLVVLRMNQEH